MPEIVDGKPSLFSVINAIDSYELAEGILIRGKKGSEAEHYAEEYGCLFEEI